MITHATKVDDVNNELMNQFRLSDGFLPFIEEPYYRTMGEFSADVDEVKAMLVNPDSIRGEVEAAFENTVGIARGNPPDESYAYAARMAGYVMKLIGGKSNG